MKIRNALYTVAYDGDLLSYKCRGLACTVFGILGWTKHFEIPANTLLYQESKSFGFLRLTNLYINHYSHSQKKLTPRRIRHFALLSLNQKKGKRLLNKLDQIIAQNLIDDTNLGLKHISKADLEVFYTKVHRQPTPETVGIPIPGMATMQAHKISQAS